MRSAAAAAPPLTAACLPAAEVSAEVSEETVEVKVLEAEPTAAESAAPRHSRPEGPLPGVPTARAAAPEAESAERAAQLDPPTGGEREVEEGAPAGFAPAGVGDFEAISARN